MREARWALVEHTRSAVSASKPQFNREHRSGRCAGKEHGPIRPTPRRTTLACRGEAHQRGSVFRRRMDELLVRRTKEGLWFGPQRGVRGHTWQCDQSVAVRSQWQGWLTSCARAPRTPGLHPRRTCAMASSPLLLRRRRLCSEPVLTLQIVSRQVFRFW